MGLLKCHRNYQKLTQELSGRFSVFPAHMGTYHSWGWYLSISALLVWWAMKCESAVKLRELDNVCQDAVLFLGHVVVSVDGPLTVTLMLSSSHLMVCYISSNLKVIPVWPFFPVLHRVWGRRMIQRTHRKQLDLTTTASTTNFPQISKETVILAFRCCWVSYNLDVQMTKVHSFGSNCIVAWFLEWGWTVWLLDSLKEFVHRAFNSWL